MKHLLTGTVLAAAAITLNAADYTTNNGQFSVGINLKGAAVTELKNIKKSPLIAQVMPSYTERLYTIENGKMVIEKFGNYKFSVESSNYKHRKTADITFTAKGVSAFDWLRISKKYTFDWGKPYFTVKYTLKNIDSKSELVLACTRKHNGLSGQLDSSFLIDLDSVISVFVILPPEAVKALVLPCPVDIGAAYNHFIPFIINKGNEIFEIIYGFHAEICVIFGQLTCFGLIA